MPYIGKSPLSGGGFHKLGNLTASATATYALTLNGAAYFPETANQLLVSLNGVIQAPQDSFTVSGSNLVFDSALTSNDSIDFVVALGDVLGVQGVTDGTVTTAKISNGAVTDAKIDTMAASKLTGALPAIDGSALTGLGGGTSVAVIGDQKTQGTAGGSVTAGSWFTRDLNTEFTDPDAIVSISSNQFTLGAGKYLIEFSVPGHRCGKHRARLYNSTATSVVAESINHQTDANANVTTVAIGNGYVDISSSTVFEIQQRVTTSRTTNGLGLPFNLTGEVEFYTQVTILKVG